MRIVILPALLLAACSADPVPTAENAEVEVANDPGAKSTAATPTVNEDAPTAPGPAPIPARFRGTWAEDAAACADLKHHSRITISGRTVRFPTFVFFGDSVTFPAANQFAVKGKLGGTDQTAEAHYSINAAGDVLTDEAGGGAVRVRCG